MLPLEHASLTLTHLHTMNCPLQLDGPTSQLAPGTHPAQRALLMSIALVANEDSATANLWSDTGREKGEGNKDPMDQRGVGFCLQLRGRTLH